MDKHKAYIDFIVSSMLHDTSYEYYEPKNTVFITFPMYEEDDNRISYSEYFIRNMEWDIGAMDIEYVESNYGVREDEIEIIYRLYWERLSNKIVEDIFNE